MKQNKKILFGTLIIIIFLAVLNFWLMPNLASAQIVSAPDSSNGIVPCGKASGETTPCTLCHLIIGIQRLVQYGLYLVTTAAFVGIFLAGLMYIISSGDENMMTKAKDFLKVSVVGFAIVIAAWLIVNVTMWFMATNTNLGVIPSGSSWYQFSCSTSR